MEKELKTLKDFLESNYLKEIPAVCIMEDFKQDIISDIKLRRKGSALPIARDDIESYIKWKFNITEGDLE